MLCPALGLLVSGPLQAATSLSKNGVTWSFDRDYVTGQYANGDHWVVGPVVITNITPKPIDGQNGTMINPGVGTTQGFDKDFAAGYNDYVSALNVGQTLPLSVPAGKSVVSSITAAGYTQYNTIEMFSVLTVVTTAPEAGSFRPPAIGSGTRNSLWKESQIDYSKLRTFANFEVPAAPALTNYETWFSYPWFELNPNWTGRSIHPSYMAPTGYGRDMAYRTGDAALLLNLNFTNTQKRKLLIGLIQCAIDNYGFIASGGTWYNDGGHNLGRLTPLIVAAAVLNDSTLKGVIQGSAMKFHEYQSTFFVTQADVDRTGRLGTNGQPSYPYTASNIGMAEWGIRHTGAPQYDNNWWGAQYRDTNGSSHTAPTMAAKVMGMRSVMDWEPLFKYAERHVNYEQSTSYGGEFNYNSTPLFHKQFYNKFGGTAPPPVVTPPSFSIGNRIKLNKQTNVRTSGALTATLLGTQPLDATGTIIGGPVGPDANNITWWQMNWDSGVDGWCGHDNFVLLPSAPPSAPAGLRIE